MPKRRWRSLGFFVVICALLMPACTRGSVSGEIELSPSDDVSARAVLFLIARDPSDPNGPPLAIKRFDPPLKFPIAFRLTDQDSMVPNTPLKRQILIHARLAQSGVVAPVTPGDIEGEPTGNPVVVPAKNLRIVLDEVKR